MSTVSRPNGIWELKAPGQPHFSTSREGGHLLLHARHDCSNMTDPATTLSWKIVNTLWEKDVAASTTEDENDVQWCTNCATRTAAPDSAITARFIDRGGYGTIPTVERPEKGGKTQGPPPPPPPPPPPAQ